DLSDKDTWLASKQMNPHPDAKPDLFDERNQKKPAYYGVLEALREAATKN
ncbi:MAG: endo-1,4-beta-xylanase, partial [bacterium]